MALALLCAAAAHATPAAQVPVGPRAIGMSGAFTSVADDATALFWNPAGLARISHQEVTASHANLFRSSIQDNYAAFVLPLSPDVTAAADWYHSGFDDGELGFGENRVTLAGAMKVSPWLYAGFGAKLLARSTGLDGTTLRQGRGFGYDLGLLALPTERLHFGLVAQDAFDTRVQDDGGASDVAYPRNVRLGSSYRYRRWGTVAFDLDDRWHLGVELTPIDALALRFGTEDDRQGYERGTWSYGLGFKTGLLRADWARVQHPTLEATDHFSLAMEFNFNPAQIHLEKIQLHDVYTSLYKSYAREPMGTIQVRNLQDRPLQARVSVFVPELMDGPSDQDVLLRPRATLEVPLTAVLSERALTQRGDRPVQVQISASYQSQRLARRERVSGRAVAYAPGAIEWGNGVAQAAAFVTPRDPAVDAVAREAARLVSLRESDPLGNRNLSFTAAMVDALADLGVAYVPDPNNPFTAIAETPHAVDTIHYPYQTLETRSGDCDDTTVLLASLLGNVGVPTRIVDAPGHVFLLVGTGLHERNRAALGVDESRYTIVDEEVWIPVETTVMGRGFAESWRVGAEEYSSWNARGQLQLVDVAEAQARYEPVVPPGERHPPALNTGRLASRIEAARDTISRWRDDFYAAQFGGVPKELVASASALEEIARVSFLGGDLAGARELLERALRRAPQSVSVHNNLGVVLAAQDSLGAAEEHWRTAMAIGGRNPHLWLNLGLARYVQGDSVEAEELLARGLAGAGGYEGACRLMGLPVDDAEDRSGTAPLSEAEARARLRGALRRVPARTISRVGSGTVPAPLPTLRPSRLRTAATRATNQTRLEVYLCWIE